MGPEQLCNLTQSDVEGLIQRFGDLHNRHGKSRRYINTIINRLNTFFQRNGYPDLKIEHLHVPTRYRSRAEYIPTKADVYSMVDHAVCLRDRAIILCLFSSGLRLGTMRALNYGDISEEIESGNHCIQIDVTPKLKERVHGACKGGIPYYTFFSNEAVEALQSYFRERMEIYGALNDDDPVFASRWRLYDKRDRPKSRLSHPQINQLIKKIAKLAGIQQWKHISAHSFRKSFESVLRSQTIDGGRLDKGTQEFFIGHILPGSQDYYYDRNDIEFHRREYLKLDFGRPTNTRLSDLFMTTVRLASDLSESPEAILQRYIKKRYQGSLTWQQLSEDRKIRLMNEALEWWSEYRNEKTFENTDKVIDISDTAAHLDQGYAFVTALDERQVVVRKVG